MPGKRASLEARFWAKVDKDSSSKGCWLWTAATGNYGYGILGKGGRGDGLIRAHRFSYMIHKGDVPIGMKVLHSCDNPPCVNPDHLFIGTQLDNVADMDKKGRRINAPNKGFNHYKWKRVLEKAGYVS